MLCERAGEVVCTVSCLESKGCHIRNEKEEAVEEIEGIKQQLPARQQPGACKESSSGENACEGLGTLGSLCQEGSDWNEVLMGVEAVDLRVQGSKLSRAN